MSGALEAAEQLRAMFRYGWRADDEQMHAYVEQCVREAATDWLNAGAVGWPGGNLTPRLPRNRA
jgi:anaerobic selenocysteine-containing dehydrogenase